ncbi:toll/interleukin-1 receptor domain-containing protein [Chitinophaga sancti]|uniref:TIR domain-containing protein n=1 Tax=Chitinophaga sancti TaxID=1004 RepID=A0A1K1S2Z3_9BACT|nr:toll/interleukin-1 receptor domain-containing protein [Chitinophaga sancti]WQD59650.1 toll/interleukin-1 receptor domain-containing protein [Chitinophaga sancti]WQG88219.1 toll/interleukin-1 receptor domain-containing protein [Chitinophaga sancti]SFW78468.1 TIR domain-containing protein [Chitinophaga sancti]
MIEGLQDHLSVKTGAKIEFLRDKDIGMGADWKATIGENIRKADAAIILVSAAHLSSPFIRKEESGEFFKRATADGSLILPVLVRNCDFRAFEELSGLQFFPLIIMNMGISLSAIASAAG